MIRLALLTVALVLLGVADAAAIDPRRAQEERASAPQRRETRVEPTTSTPAPTPAPTSRTPRRGTPVDGNWLITMNDEIAVYADQTSVLDSGGRTRMWTTWVNRRPSEAGEKYFVALMEADCAAQRMQILQSVSYSAMAEQIETLGITDPPSYPTPNTIFHYIMRHVCADYGEWAGSLEAVRLADIRDVVSYTDAVLFPDQPTVLVAQTVPQARISNREHEQLLSTVAGYLDMAQRELVPSGNRAQNTAQRVDRIQPGQDMLVNVQMTAGQTYTVIGACDDDCKDIDLEILDSARRVVSRDALSADFPRVRFTPPLSGQYQVRVLLQQCSLGPCYVGARVLQ